MLKRSFDVIVSGLGLIVTSPVLLAAMAAIFLQDYRSPFYIASRVGKDGRAFDMVKLRSMVVAADRSGVDSTSAADPRITAVGRAIRAFKLDELSQLWNVLLGQMSLVGPRPNVRRETELYTEVERRLLTVKPGITDLASIVFADEGTILRGKDDPDIAYNQLIRPWKSRLGLLYIDNASLRLDLRLIWLTVVNMVARRAALAGVACILARLNAPVAIRTVALRRTPLAAAPPPGAERIVTERGASP